MLLKQGGGFKAFHIDSGESLIEMINGYSSKWKLHKPL